MNERNIAIAAGLKTYTSAKPCRRGHASERYSSTGQCIACLKHQIATQRTAAAAARVRRYERLDVGDMVEVIIMVPRKYSAIANDISDMMASENYEQNVTAIRMMNRCTLNREQLVVLLDWRDGVANITHQTRHNDAGYVEVALNGHWYLGDDIRAVLQGTAETCDKVFQ